MSDRQEPLAEVTSRAFEILYRELGPVDTLRFIGQFTTGLGDYTVERDALQDSRTLDQILAEIREKKPRG